MSSLHKVIWPQTILKFRPPSSLDYRTRHGSQSEFYESLSAYYTKLCFKILKFLRQTISLSPEQAIYFTWSRRIIAKTINSFFHFQYSRTIKVMSKVDHEKKKILLQLTILTMRATNIKATGGAVATKAVAVGGRACACACACACELYTMKQCCLGSGDCCLYSTRAHTRNKNDVFVGVTFSAAKIVRCNKKFFYLRHYFNCSTLVSNPIMWQFEKSECSSKTFFPVTILGICFVFSIIHISPLFYSQTISLETEI
jgi:hypothetical protein